MKLMGEQRALERLREVRDEFRGQISDDYEFRARSCATCPTKGACCVDEHFVNVHVSRLEAVAIKRSLDKLPKSRRSEIKLRIDAAIAKYDLSVEGNTFSKTYACPLFETGTGCLVHGTAKPLPCIAHACYENAADLPPEHLLAAREQQVDDLNVRTYGKRQPWLPLPVAISKIL